VSSQRDRIAMTATEVEAYLQARRTLILCTTGPDGLPDPVPMWFVVGADGVPTMRTYAKSQKVANLRRDPRAVGLVEDGEQYDELRGVQLTGRVELVDDLEAILDVTIGLARRYQGMTAEQAPAAREGLRDYAAKQVAMRLLADRVVSWDHRKLG
jgi:PPOX class probable F420-dependent enzyme